MNTRVEKLQSILSESQLDGYIVAKSGNMQYLIDEGSIPWQRTIESGGPPPYFESPEAHALNMPDSVLYIPVDGEPRLILTPQAEAGFANVEVAKTIVWFDALERYLTDMTKGRRVAYGESCGGYFKRILEQANPEFKPVFGEHIVENMRKIKEPKEIQKLRELAAFTDTAMQYVTENLKEGMLSRDIEDMILQYGLRNGMEGVSFSTTAMFVHPTMPRANELGVYDRDFPLVAGASIAFDFGFMRNGYCSDYGRSFCFKETTDEINAAYKALQYAQTEYIKLIKPGVKMDDAFVTIKALLAEHGFGDNIRRAGENCVMGHQIGIDVHERPWLSLGSDAVYEAGMVFCSEPKLWLPGKAYLRVEDMILITENGAESLTHFDRELFVIGK